MKLITSFDQQIYFLEKGLTQNLREHLSMHFAFYDDVAAHNQSRLRRAFRQAEREWHEGKRQGTNA